MGYNAPMSDKDDKKAMDEVVRRMLKTPPQPKKSKPKKDSK
jgi:hypothetical protein